MANADVMILTPTITVITIATIYGIYLRVKHSKEVKVNIKPRGNTKQKQSNNDRKAIEQLDKKMDWLLDEMMAYSLMIESASNTIKTR